MRNKKIFKLTGFLIFIFLLIGAIYIYNNVLSKEVCSYNVEIVSSETNRKKYI